MSHISPIALFAYNRPDHLARTIEALRQNKLASESELYIFCDGPKKAEHQADVKKVRKIAHSIDGFLKVNIIESDINKGLANSVIEGVSRLLQTYDRVIVMEDDMITTEPFLNYMNEALEFYQNKKDIYSITGYSFPISIPKDYTLDVYASPRPSSWGWGTWNDRWSKADWQVGDRNVFLSDKNIQNQFNLGGVDLSKMLTRQLHGEIDSWAIRWAYTHFKQNGLCVYPVHSYINNIGNDDSGTHAKSVNKYNWPVLNTKPTTLTYPLSNKDRYNV